MKKKNRARGRRGLAAALTLASCGAMAADGFQVRYNVSGTLGSEIFSPIDLQGWAGSISFTQVRIDGVTGPDGAPLTAVNPAGTSPSGAVRYGPSQATLASSGRLAQYNALLAYITPDNHAGGRLAVAVNIPYVSKKTQSASILASTPAATRADGSPLSPAALDAFNASYQAMLASRSASDSGEVDGPGDIELHAGWLHREPRLRVMLGASLVIPTGRSDPTPYSGPDVSQGNFYTLRPVAQVVHYPQPDIALGAKVTLGINSRNRDNGVRSGNWASLEGTSGWRTRYGVFGLQTILVRQFQDDGGGLWGANRLRSDNLGAFYTSRLAIIDASLTLQYMKTMRSRNAKHGDFLQMRLSRSF